MRYQARLHPTLDILCDSLGRVFLPKSGPNKAHWTFGYLGPKGYRLVTINRKRYRVSRLICETFHGLAPEDRPTCDHISRDRDSNVPWNLRWADCKLQNNNRQICEDSLKKYGVRKCEDPNAYQRERRARDPEVAERNRAMCRKYYAENIEREHARCRAKAREYQAKQKALGKRTRKCPDGKKHLLTDEEFFEKFGFWPKK